ncbi:MAG: hypothetical protein BA869_02480 [Desulfuromonadales bacterium C00003107]|nr:MAG: hypothetical protein BA869_02480 [Desulfuromonadales bacterium C00003107]
MQRLGVRILLLMLVGVLLAGCKPATEQGIEDRVGLLTSVERQRVADFQHSLLQDYDIELKVVVLERTAADLDQKALQLFEEYGVGRQTHGARGLLLVIDPLGHQLRLEVGYDLEGLYPDGFVGYVENQQMAPFFQAGRVGAGIEATVELLIGRAAGVGAADGVDGGTPLTHLSGGGGARIDIELGSGAPVKEQLADSEPFAAADTPEKTLRRYLKVLQGHIKDPDLGLFTPSTREFFQNWLVTDAQQDNELRELQGVIDQGKTVVADGLAVLRFPIDKRRNSPYLLRRGEKGWMLDFAAMSRLIGFNHRNQWFFRSTGHEFMFAFADVQFDGNGFPHEKP